MARAEPEGVTERGHQPERLVPNPKASRSVVVNPNGSCRAERRSISDRTHEKRPVERALRASRVCPAAQPPLAIDAAGAARNLAVVFKAVACRHSPRSMKAASGAIEAYRWAALNPLALAEPGEACRALGEHASTHKAVNSAPMRLQAHLSPKKLIPQPFTKNTEKTLPQPGNRLSGDNRLQKDTEKMLPHSGNRLSGDNRLQKDTEKMLPNNQSRPSDDNRFQKTRTKRFRTQRIVFQAITIYKTMRLKCFRTTETVSQKTSIYTVYTTTTPQPERPRFRTPVPNTPHSAITARRAVRKPAHSPSSSHAPAQHAL
jgi:hypothetical protein